VAIEDLYNSKQEEMEDDDMEDDDYMKKGDLAASFVQCGDEICLSVIEIIEFQFGTEKTAHVTATLDHLEDINNKIKVTGQIIELKPSSLRMAFWEWTRNYLSVVSETKEHRLSHQNYVMEIP
jgi:hypothetical protein